MHPSEQGRDLQNAKDRENVERMFSVFNNLEVENDQGKKIKIILKRPTHRYRSSVPSDSEYLLEFEGLEGIQKGKTTILPENFVWYSVDFSANAKEIVPEYASIENEDLKSHTPGKGVYPQIRRLIGQNFPPGFTYHAEVQNKRTRAEFLEIVQKVESGMPKREGKLLLQAHYKIRERVASGFNVNKIIYDREDMRDFFIDSRKDDGGHESFDVDFGI